MISANGVRVFHPGANRLLGVRRHPPLKLSDRNQHLPTPPDQLQLGTNVLAEEVLSHPDRRGRL